MPDRKYNDILVGRFVNSIMYDGMKQKAEGILYDAFDIIREKLNNDPIETFKKAIESHLSIECDKNGKWKQQDTCSRVKHSLKCHNYDTERLLTISN